MRSWVVLCSGVPAVWDVGFVLLRTAAVRSISRAAQEAAVSLNIFNVPKHLALPIFVLEFIHYFLFLSSSPFIQQFHHRCVTVRRDRLDSTVDRHHGG